MSTIIFLLSHPIWTFIATISGIVLSIVGLYSNRKQIPKKLTYGIISSVPIVTTNITNQGQTERKKLTVIYDGNPVTDVYVTTVKIRNMGNTIITQSDFLTQLEFIKFKGKIFSTGIVDKSVDVRDVPALKAGENEVIIEKFMLAAGEWFTFKVVSNKKVTGTDLHPFIKMKDVQVKQFNESHDNAWSPRLQKIRASAVLFLFVASIGLSLVVVFSMLDPIVSSVIVLLVTSLYLAIILNKIKEFIYRRIA